LSGNVSGFDDLCDLPNMPKNSVRLSGGNGAQRQWRGFRQLHRGRLADVQSVWPMIAISFPPFTAQARNEHRAAWGPVMILPALQQNAVPAARRGPAGCG
jgi:hypothetical protein